MPDGIPVVAVSELARRQKNFQKVGTIYAGPIRVYSHE
jgi:hypothetical protein